MMRTIPIARKRAVRSLRIFSYVVGLEDFEVYFDIDCNGYGFAVQTGRLEVILLDCG